MGVAREKQSFITLRCVRSTHCLSRAQVTDRESVTPSELAAWESRMSNLEASIQEEKNRRKRCGFGATFFMLDVCRVEEAVISHTDYNREREREGVGGMSFLRRVALH